MGIGPGNRCKGIIYQDKIVNINPNPSKFKIIKIFELENTYAEILYPDCKNYEGLKILVFKGKVAGQLSKIKEIDPHFDDKKQLSPMARFKPDNEGRWLALKLAKGFPDIL